MAMNASYITVLANAGRAAITHLGLVDAGGAEVAPRQSVTWTAENGGVIRPTADLTFNVGAGSTVAGWRGYTAATDGTNHGGAALTAETFTGAGQYILEASATSINHA